MYTIFKKLTIVCYEKESVQKNKNLFERDSN